MNNQKLASLSLLVSPIILLLGWAVLGVMLGFEVNPHKPQLYIESLGENKNLVKIIFPLVSLFLLLLIGGVRFIKTSMDGGSGYFVVGFGLMIMVIAAAGLIAGAALQIGVADAASTTFAGGWSQTAQTLFAAANSIGALATGAMFIGFALVGIGILVQKSFHSLICGLMVISGLYTAAISVVDYNNPLIAVGYIGFCLSCVALGVTLMRSSE